MRLLFNVMVLFFLSSVIIGQITSDDMKYMREYYFVELIRIPNRPTLDSTTTAKIQAAHLNNIDSLQNVGKLVVAGPFGDDKGGGIFILKAESMDEAIKMCESDPAIKNGRLNYKVRPLWTDMRVFTIENK